MFPLLVDVMKQIDIPSVFVSEETANSLKEDYTYDKGYVYTQIFFLPININRNTFLLLILRIQVTLV